MSHSFKEQTFKGKPVSQLSQSEWNQYRRECQKYIKRQIKGRQTPIKSQKKEGEGMNECKFYVAWVSQCKHVADESGYCEEHKQIVCKSCGKKATHSCSETMGLVCGSPLCNECEHTLCENGYNSGAPLPEGMEDHCKKGAQVFKPWYLQDDEGQTNQKGYENDRHSR